MFRFLKLGATCAALASPAAAEVTAEDVLSNLKAFYAATGGTMHGELIRNGAEVRLNAPQITYRFPAGAGAITIDLPELTMTETGGGVDMTYPGTAQIGFLIDIIELGRTSATVDLVLLNYAGRAEGDPGDITYTQSAEIVSLSLIDPELPPSADQLDLFAFMSMFINGLTTTSRVTEGDLIVITSDSEIQAVEGHYMLDFASALVENQFAYNAGKSSSTITLPAGGSDIFDLSPAVRAGLAIVTDFSGDGSSGTTRTSVLGEIISEQTSRVGQTQTSLRFDKDGFVVTGSANDLFASVNEPAELPIPFELEVALISGGYNFPVLASPEPQGLSLDLLAQGIRIGPDFWNLLDPEKGLPRDPAEVRVAAAAEVVSDVDLPNVLSWEAAFGGSTLPGALNSLRIDAMDMSILGVSMATTADFVFDMTDLETFDGLPRPEGDMVVSVHGAQSLLDRLEALGLLTADEIGQARFGIGMFGRATGDDRFETTVEVNAAGHVMLNGQRMR